MQWLAVAFGGALGAMARFAVAIYIAPLVSGRFPWSTLTVNITGSFLMGICYVVLDEKLAAPPEVRFIIMTGFLGAFTTYSTFSLDALTLWDNGMPLTALLYVMCTLIGCLLAVSLAVFAAQRAF